MNRECLCDLTSEETPLEEKNEEEDEEDAVPCNRIFLNFTRECRHPVKDRHNLLKVKELFKCLAERPELQEMKVSGWRDEGKEEQEEEDEEEKDGLESLYDDDRDTPKEGGQRFAMSRDFWYRKLNILKAQKLDEAALETKDIPPDSRPENPPGAKWIRNHKTYATDAPESPGEVLRDLETFDEYVGKPTEKKLRRGFVNVYDNRRTLRGSCPP